MQADIEFERLIEQLPELYQPLYGMDARPSSRTAELPRMTAVTDLTRLLASHLGRPLRVIDLGSAQGYLAFVLAEAGHHVTGVDYLPINVQVARALHDRHPHLDVEFIEGDVTEVPSLAAHDGFDLVLGLSILHHVVQRDGLERALEFVEQLRDRVPNGLFEMALRDEPVYWAPSQPSDPRILLSPYSFMRRLASSPTHLSEIVRPLFFCSDRLALAHGELHAIRKYSETSHAAARDVMQGKCRYFTLDIGLMKIAARYSENAEEKTLDDIRGELRHEAEMLSTLRKSGVTVPDLIEFADLDDESVIVKSMYPGVLVSEINRDLGEADRARISDDVLAELAIYEQLGLFHTDLRLWNVIWDADERVAHLIDHGSLGATTTDVVWPGDAIYSLVVFLWSLWSGSDDRTGVDDVRIVPSADLLPARAGRMVAWMLARQRSGHFFRDAAEYWAGDSRLADQIESEPSLAQQWLADFGERLLDERKSARAASALQAAYDAQADAYAELSRVYAETSTQRDELADGYARLEAVYAEALAGYERLHEEYDSALESYERLNASYATATDRAAFLEADLQTTSARIAAMESSVSWRISRPIRLLGQLARKVTDR